MNKHGMELPRALAAFVLEGGVSDLWTTLADDNAPNELSEGAEAVINAKLREGVDLPDARFCVIGACISKFIPSKNFNSAVDYVK